MTTLQTRDVEDSASAEDFRQVMVADLIADQDGKGQTLRPEVVEAFRAVPRHMFAPEASLEEAYKHDAAVITKRDGAEALSSVSAPWLQAEMISQAAGALNGLQGRHVLEIGSGGYNAALLCELVGTSGSVTTVDIDPFVTDRATGFLKAAGYADVTVICADGDRPVEPARSYDAIIVTVGAWDIPPAWIDQLTEGGVLVVPLRTLGMTRSWALRQSGDGLISISQFLCGFVSMRGDGAHEVRFVDLAEGVHLRLDEGQQVDPATASGFLAQPREQAWAGVSLPPRTTLADLDLWLAVHLPGEDDQFVVLTANQEAIDSGIIAPGWQYGTPAVISADTFSYRSALRWTDRTFDLGACAHGPQAAAAAELVVEHMRAWVDADQPSPVLHVLPTTTPADNLPAGTVLDKRHSRLVLTFTPA